MWIPPHSHTLTPRLKILHPLLFIPCTDSIVRQRLQRAAGDPGSISLQQPNLRQRAPQLNPVSSPPNRPFPFCAGHDREASPGPSEGTRSLLGQKSLVPSSRRWPMPGFLRKSVLSSLTALLLSCGGIFNVVCFKPHSLILSFPNIQHPCTLLTSGFFQKIGDFQWGSQVSSQW